MWRSFVFILRLLFNMLPTMAEDKADGVLATCIIRGYRHCNLLSGCKRRSITGNGNVHDLHLRRTASTISKRRKEEHSLISLYSTRTRISLHWGWHGGEHCWHAGGRACIGGLRMGKFALSLSWACQFHIVCLFFVHVGYPTWIMFLIELWAL